MKQNKENPNPFWMEPTPLSSSPSLPSLVKGTRTSPRVLVLSEDNAFPKAFVCTGLSHGLFAALPAPLTLLFDFSFCIVCHRIFYKIQFCLYHFPAYIPAITPHHFQEKKSKLLIRGT